MVFRTMAAFGLSMIAVGAALAQGIGQRQIPVRAATLLIESDSVIVGPNLYPRNHTPHVWFNLDRNRSAKPRNVDLSNPLHETQFTDALFTRWNALGGTPPPVGTSVQKRFAPYWELRLRTATEDQLASVDVMLLAAYGPISLSPSDRDKLRRFLERGGILWVDVDSNTTLDSINTLPLPFNLTGAATGTGPEQDSTNPLINFPNRVTEFDLRVMQTDTTLSAQPVDLVDYGLVAYERIFQTLQPDSLRFSAVAEDERGPYVLSARLGDGFVVLTTRGVARAINRIPTASAYLANQGAVGLPPLSDRASDAASKLAINLIYLASSSNQFRAGTRQAGSVAVDVGAPHIPRFSDGAFSYAPSSPNAYRPPAVAKGLVAISTDDRVLVYDNNPAQDLDGDGNPDDGTQDYSLGETSDLIWASNTLAGPLSSPIIIDVPNAAAGMQTQVVVVDSSGNVLGFPALPFDANGRLVGDTNVAPTYSVAPPNGAPNYDLGQPDAGPYSPVFHEGLLFLADVQDSGLGRSGRVWLADPARGQNVRSNANGWSVGGNAAAVFTEMSAPVTVGYVPIADNSGGVDKVVYVPTRPNPLGGGPQANAGITSLWFGAKGERPAQWQQGGGFLEVNTRASTQGLNVYLPDQASEEPSLGVRLSLLHPDGRPYSQAEMTAVLTGAVSQTNGIVRFGISGALPIDVGIRIDYTIDWGTGSPSDTNQIVRGSVNLPDNDNRQRRILHGLALSPEGTLHLTMSSQNVAVNPGGSYFAIREEGRGNFKVLNRYDLFNRHQVQLNQAQAATVTYPNALSNTDPLATTLVPFLNGPLDDLTFMSGPVVRDGVAYVTAMARRRVVSIFGTFFVPSSLVLAFRAEPEAMTLNVGNLSAGFQILQPDVVRSDFAAGTAPGQFTSLQPGQYVYEQQGVDRGTIRIENLSATGRGPMTNVLSTSQPVILRQNGQADILFEPDQAGGRWSQLLWYVVFPGVEHTAPAFVTGKSLFIAGQSATRDFVNGVFPPSYSGSISAMSTDIPANDTFLNSGEPNRPWVRQLYTFRGTNWGNAEPNPSLLMPSYKGVTSFGDFVIRLEQTQLALSNGTVSSNALGVVAAENGLFAWGNGGFWGFGRANFLVADSNRVARLDSDGSPIWSMNATFRTGQSGDTGAAGITNPLVQVTRAYPLADREMLLVDTGANRVVRTDANGRELRIIEGVNLDPNYRPREVPSNLPLALSGPRDVKTYRSIVPAANNPFTNAQPFESWTHYLIADTGNRRLVEVVDRFRYDVTRNRIGDVVEETPGIRAVGRLFWHSPVQASGGQFAYSALDRVFVSGTTPRYVVVAGIGGTLPTRVDTGLDAPNLTALRQTSDGNGGIVIFDGSNTQVINEVNLPGFSANIFWNDRTASWNSLAVGPRVKRLGGLNSISVRNVTGGTGDAIAIMFTDNEGVFEAIGDLIPNSAFNVTWLVNRDAYRSIRRNPVTDVPEFGENPDDFRPTYARRLESGDVLITNGYSGFYRRSTLADLRVPFSGEVVLLQGGLDPAGNNAALGFNPIKRNLGFRTISIRALLNNRPGANLDTRGIVSPVFADKQ